MSDRPAAGARVQRAATLEPCGWEWCNAQIVHRGGHWVHVTAGASAHDPHEPRPLSEVQRLLTGAGHLAQ